jgi:transposase
LAGSGLTAAAHRTLSVPLIAISDNLNTHRSKKMRAFSEALENWLTVVQLPGYAPDLNAVEGAWSAMKSRCRVAMFDCRWNGL